MQDLYKMLHTSLLIMESRDQEYDESDIGDVQRIGDPDLKNIQKSLRTLKDDKDYSLKRNILIKLSRYIDDVMGTKLDYSRFIKPELHSHLRKSITRGVSKGWDKIKDAFNEDLTGGDIDPIIQKMKDDRDPYILDRIILNILIAFKEKVKKDWSEYSEKIQNLISRPKKSKTKAEKVTDKSSEKTNNISITKSLIKSFQEMHIEDKIVLLKRLAITLDKVSGKSIKITLKAQSMGSDTDIDPHPASSDSAGSIGKDVINEAFTPDQLTFLSKQEPTKLNQHFYNLLKQIINIKKNIDWPKFSDQIRDYISTAKTTRNRRSEDNDPHPASPDSIGSIGEDVISETNKESIDKKDTEDVDKKMLDSPGEYVAEQSNKRAKDFYQSLINKGRSVEQIIKNLQNDTRPIAQEALKIAKEKVNKNSKNLKEVSQPATKTVSPAARHAQIQEEFKPKKAKFISKYKIHKAKKLKPESWKKS
jgi:hypothetical protein